MDYSGDLTEPTTTARPATVGHRTDHRGKRPADPSTATPTVAVEEEFLLVDPLTAQPLPVAADVLDAAGTPPVPGARFQPELSAAQVEVATGVSTSLHGLRSQVSTLRQALAGAARDLGVSLLPAGVPVAGSGELPLSPGERFAAMGDRFRRVLTDYACCACHVHIGVPSRDHGVAVVNHLRPWLPTLLAVSVNSPLYRGYDTGYGSWRIIQQTALPGWGIPPRFATTHSYDNEVERLVSAGVLIDDRMTFWLARPSAHVPTVELRVADTACSVDHVLVQAALARALVQQALLDVESDVPAPQCADGLAAAALWSAARYGITGPGVDLRYGRRTPAITLLADLLDHVRPALEESGDLHTIRTLLDRLLTAGTGADQQRRAAADSGVPGLINALAIPPPNNRGTAHHLTKSAT